MMQSDAMILEQTFAAEARITSSGRGRDHRRASDSSPWKGLVAGLAGGIAGTWMMTQFQNLWSGAPSRDDQSDLEGSEDASRNEDGESDAGESAGTDDDQSSTEKIATIIARGVFGRELNDQEREAASNAVSYAFGAAMGAVYGTLAELAPGARAGAGMAFGTAVWAGADEGVVPALGLSESPLSAPLDKHLLGLASHLVYGLTTEATRRIVRSLVR